MYRINEILVFEFSENKNKKENQPELILFSEVIGCYGKINIDLST